MEVQKYTQQVYDKLPDAEYWIDKANTWRSTTIRDLQRGRVYPMPFYQTATYQIKSLTQHGSVDGVEVNRATKMHYVIFPEINDSVWKEIIYFGMDKNFTRKSLDGFNNLEGNRHTSHMPCYVIIGGNKAYIKNIPTPASQLITMTAIHANPLQVPGHDYEKTNYPISEMHLPQLEYLLKREVFSYLGLEMPTNSKQGETENEQRE